MKKKISLERLELAIEKIIDEVKLVKTPKNWLNLKESILWNELVSCILGSQVSFELAQSATKSLNENKLLEIKTNEFDLETFEKNIREHLSKPLFYSKNNKKPIKYRFPNLKSRQLAETASKIYGQNKSIRTLLKESNTEKEARKNIIIHSTGIGPKQASLFLRNVGFAKNLAILDVHLIRYMKIVGMLPLTFKKTLNLNLYETIENKLKNYAQVFNCDLSYFDTAVWVVMRVYQREYAI